MSKSTADIFDEMVEDLRREFMERCKRSCIHVERGHVAADVPGRHKLLITTKPNCTIYYRDGVRPADLDIILEHVPELFNIAATNFAEWIDATVCEEHGVRMSCHTSS